MVVPIVGTREMNTIIKSLNNKSSNTNDIAATLIKKSEVFAIPLTLLFNQSIAIGIFPNMIKTAKISSIYKSGPHDDLPSHDQITRHRDQFNLPYVSQSSNTPLTTYIGPKI